MSLNLNWFYISHICFVPFHLYSSEQQRAERSDEREQKCYNMSAIDEKYRRTDTYTDETDASEHIHMETTHESTRVTP